MQAEQSKMSVAVAKEVQLDATLKTKAEKDRRLRYKGDDLPKAPIRRRSNNNK